MRKLWGMHSVWAVVVLGVMLMAQHGPGLIRALGFIDPDLM